MKNIVLMLLFCLMCQLTKAQKIDMVNAPRNPIGFKHKKEHFFLRGDIYSSSGKIFDQKGNLIFNYGTRYYYNANGRITGNNYDDTFEYDSRGNIIKFKYKSGGITTYKFSPKDLLVHEKSSYGDEKTYTYDNKDRLSSTIIKKKGKLSQKRLFTYSKKGDSLIVDMEYMYTNGKNGFMTKSYYINGFLVKEQLSSGTYTYVVKTDAKQNKIDFYTAGVPNPKHYRTFNRYFSDANKPIKLELGYYKVNESTTAKKATTIYVNGTRSTDITISKGVKPNEKVIYDGLTHTYYAVPNIVPENHTIDTRIPVTTVLSKGKPYINYVSDGKFINYVYGFNKVKSRDFAFLGAHMIDYRIDKTLGRTYIIRNYKNIKEQKVKQMELFSADTASILYTRELKKDNFFILDKGKHIDYKKARFEYLTNGDPVIFINEKPSYVLTGFRMAQDGEVLFGKRYNGELDNAQKTSETTKTTNKLECLEGDCNEGWGKIKVGEIITKATFKNGAIDGVAYISYPNDAYYHGKYKNNRRDGFGYYRWANGNSYIGYWKDGKQHGLGYTLDKGLKVTSAGRFENGKLVEKQATDYIAGKTAGNCKGNCSNGFGKYTYNNGDTYLGFFKNSQRYSVGNYIWSNSSEYTGVYTADGKRNGFGIYMYIDGSIYRGVFVNDRIDGLGRMKYKKTGNIVHGVFNNKGAKIKEY
ncbi:MORN motif precursor [uncultured Kordia sp.]|uniref:MORN repeat-containing protein n=1 Tax=uncultured Kordia sp. TaxID=507699 RepID=UPI00260C7A9B|nr:MORN motif precursor [uncultured Kordia sp.]